MSCALERWHAICEERNPAALDTLIAENAVFFSPVVYTPQAGKAKVIGYLKAAAEILFNDSFRYVRELRGTDEAMLEFTTTIEGIEVNGIDLIRWNMNQEITEFRVWLRPLKGLQIVQQLMATKLSAQRGTPSSCPLQRTAASPILPPVSKLRSPATW